MLPCPRGVNCDQTQSNPTQLSLGPVKSNTGFGLDHAYLISAGPRVSL